MLYFAYGSNMSPGRMKSRCPTAQFLAVAKLADYRFDFTRKCQSGYGVMDAVQCAGDDVWGVVYQIDESDLGLLDKAEGYRPGRVTGKDAYKRIEVSVLRDGEESAPLTVWTYTVVEKSPKPIATSDDYKRLVVEGAQFWQLPKDYVNRLENDIVTELHGP
ncbi:MAG: gamma-glutamylcyclotransferase [Pirellulaceae bacterium]|nr:gamma-glutamylcyclotransferase [Pirellulaceae bacterium]